jgi:hypothetical protein
LEIASQCLRPTGATTTKAATTTGVPTTFTTPPPSTSPGTTTTPAATTTGVSGSCATPSTISGYSNAKLPNPFLFNDGTPVRTKADWTCRRAQISALIQGYEAGTLPPKPSTFSATFSKSGTTGTLTVTAGNGGTTVSWANTITYPSGTAPAGGWPLIIAYEGGSIPVPAGVSPVSFSMEYCLTVM